MTQNSNDGATINVKLSLSSLITNNQDCVGWETLQVIVTNNNGYYITVNTQASQWYDDTENGGKDCIIPFDQILTPGLYDIIVYDSDGNFVVEDEQNVSENFINTGDTYEELVPIQKSDWDC